MLCECANQYFHFACAFFSLHLIPIIILLIASSHANLPEFLGKLNGSVYKHILNKYYNAHTFETKWLFFLLISEIPFMISVQFVLFFFFIHYVFGAHFIFVKSSIRIYTKFVIESNFCHFYMLLRSIEESIASLLIQKKC